MVRREDLFGCYDFQIIEYEVFLHSVNTLISSTQSFSYLYIQSAISRSLSSTHIPEIDKLSRSV